MITELGIKAALAKAKKGGRDVFLTDETRKRVGWRLVLRCLPSDGGSWLFRYTHAGKRNQIKLGTFPGMKIADARRAAYEFGERYKTNNDLIGQICAEEEAQKISEDSAKALTRQRGKFTLGSLMAMYIAHLAKTGKDETSKDVKSICQHLAPIENTTASDVTKRDLVAVQRTLLDAGKGRTANKLRSYVRAAYALVLGAESNAAAPALAVGFANEGGVDSNPAALLAVVAGFSDPRTRVLTDDEMFTLLDRAAATQGACGLAVRAAVLLGGQRMIQLLRCTTADLQDGFLVLLDPKGKRNKGPRRHPIPLEGMAGDVINEAIDIARLMGCKWLFSSDGKKHLMSGSVSQFVARESAEMVLSGVSRTPFALSDLRRTIETRLSGMGVPKDVRAHLQSHGLGGIQARHYDFYDYAREKRDALKLLHKWIQSRGQHRADVTSISEAKTKRKNL